MSPAGIKVVMVSAGPYRVLVPLAHVRETMRPLPIQALRSAPEFVLGVSILRGVSVPVVDLARLLGRDDTLPKLVRRFVSVHLDGRRVALAVSEVMGIVNFAADQFASLPPLLESVASGVVEAICLTDEKLHLFLSSSKIMDIASSSKETMLP